MDPQWNIIIADDENLECEYFRKIFEDVAFSPYRLCETFHNGQEVIDYMESSTIPTDFIILDINMPVKNGLETTRIVKETHPDTRIIINTAYAEFEFAQKAILYGVDSFLLKPTQASSILTALNRLVSKVEPLPPSPQTLENPHFCMENCNYPLETEALIMSGIQDQDLKMMRGAFETYIHFMTDPHHFSIEAAKIFLFEFLTITTRNLIKSGFNRQKSMQLKITYYYKINQIHSFEDITEILENFALDLERFIAQNADFTSSHAVPMIINYIRHNFAKDLPLHCVAEHFHFSESHLSRIIKQTTGTSFPRFLNLLRIRAAAELISNSEKEFFRIAQETGFHEVSHFNRTFRQYTNMTPGEFRKLRPHHASALLESLESVLEVHNANPS